MRWLAGVVIILAFPAQAKWRPAGGLSAIVAPHLTLPVTSLDDRAVGIGAGWHTDLALWSPGTRQAFGFRLSVDGLSGDATSGGDVFSMDLMLHGGVDTNLTRRWVLHGWGGAGWNRTDGQAIQMISLSLVPVFGWSDAHDCVISFWAGK